MLNHAWRTHNWSATYGHIEQVPIPAPHGQYLEDAYATAAHQLAHRRFLSDQIVQYATLLLQTVRPLLGAHAWTTHDCMGMDSGYDHAKLFGSMSLAAWNNYPYARGGWPAVSLAHSATQALTPSPYWVLEQIAGVPSDSHSDHVSSFTDQEFSKWLTHSRAHGAAGIVFWPGRELDGGNWAGWGGLIDPDGEPTSRLAVVRTTLESIPEMRLDPGQLRIGLLLTHDQHAMLEIDPGNPSLTVIDDLNALTIGAASLGVRVIPVADADGMVDSDTVIIPYPLIVASPVLERVDAFVRSGGCTIIGPRAEKYDSNGALTRPQSRALTERTGTTVTGHQWLSPHATVATAEVPGCRWWLDNLEVVDEGSTAVLLRAASGQPLVTARRVGTGSWVRLAAYLDAHTWRTLLQLIGTQHLERMFDLELGTEVVSRTIFNHSRVDTRTVLVESPDGAVESRKLAPNHWLVLQPDERLQTLRSRRDEH